MSATDQGTLYDQIIRVTNVYLGPAAERFIDRQVKNHLDKDPKSLNCQDLLELIDWIKVAVSLTTDDQEIVEEYEQQLVKLTKKPTPKNQRPVDDSQ